jgi:mannose/fructose/N-acetylgalactosamine-specific phosphotransferase system component IID
MLPDFLAIVLTGVAAWLLIHQQRKVIEVLGLCVAVGVVVQMLR